MSASSYYLRESGDDLRRMQTLEAAIKLGYLQSDPEDPEYCIVVPGHEKSFRRWVMHPVPYWSRGYWRNRRIGKSIWREWKTHGRVKFSMLYSQP